MDFLFGYFICIFLKIIQIFQLGINWTHANDRVISYQYGGPGGRTNSVAGIFLHDSCCTDYPFLRSIANCILDIHTEESLQVYVRLFEGVRNGMCFEQQVFFLDELFLPPANEVWGKVIFSQVFVCPWGISV